MEDLTAAELKELRWSLIHDTLSGSSGGADCIRGYRPDRSVLLCSRKAGRLLSLLNDGVDGVSTVELYHLHPYTVYYSLTVKSFYSSFYIQNDLQ